MVSTDPHSPFLPVQSLLSCNLHPFLVDPAAVSQYKHERAQLQKSSWVVPSGPNNHQPKHWCGISPSCETARCFEDSVSTVEKSVEMVFIHDVVIEQPAGELRRGDFRGIRGVTCSGLFLVLWWTRPSLGDGVDRGNGLEKEWFQAREGRAEMRTWNTNSRWMKGTISLTSMSYKTLLILTIKFIARPRNFPHTRHRATG
jgi:hypothetical protein